MWMLAGKTWALLSKTYPHGQYVTQHLNDTRKSVKFCIEFG